MTAEGAKTTSFFMERALEQARLAKEKGEIPIGAVLVHYPTNTVIAENHNRVESGSKALNHAESLVMETGFKHAKDKYLCDYDLYVTLEPCLYCFSALCLSRIRRLYFGAYNPKSKGVEHFIDLTTTTTPPEIYGGFLEQKSKALLSDFFKTLR